MKSDLEELIEAYESEKEELEKQISEYVAEADYLYAHHHNKALNQVNRVLQTLKELVNPNYHWILNEQRTIAHLRKVLAERTDDFMQSYMGKQIDAAEQRIVKWSAVKPEITYDSQEIDDALFALVDGEISGFRLYFKVYPGTFLRFALVDRVIEVNLLDDGPEVNRYDFSYLEKQIKGLGFVMENDHLKLYYPVEKFKDALDIKIILARLIYDVFQYSRQYDTAVMIYE